MANANIHKQVFPLTTYAFLKMSSGMVVSPANDYYTGSSLVN